MTAHLSYTAASFFPYSKHDYLAQTTKLARDAGAHVALMARYIALGNIDAFERSLPSKNTRAYLDRVLEKVSRSSRAVSVRELLQRSILCADALVDGIKEHKKLCYREAFIISLESLRIALTTGASPLYVKKDKKFTRAVIIDKVGGRFIILSKKWSLRQLGGTSKKVTHAFVTSFQDFQVTQAMRLTNRARSEYPVEMHKLIAETRKKEANKAQRVNGDIYVIVEHTNKRGLPKLDWVEVEYESDLDNYIFNQGSLNEAQVISLFSQIAALVFYKLHAHGIVHNDIKPENVLLSVNSDGTIRAKLTDFGLSYDRQFIEQLGRQYVCGYGTSDCSSPETFMPDKQLKDPIEQGKADDMYAMGCVLYELIFKQQIPWFHIVGTAVEAKDRPLGKAAYNVQVIGHERMKLATLHAPNLHTRWLYGICRDLLDPNPQTRLKSHQLVYRLLMY